MKTPDIPDDESARLEALRSIDILDTQAEERFDRITRMARRLFGVPIVLVSLVDENRQWFKSRQGLGASETPRDISFCGHAILGDEVFVIENAEEDERFADNPLVLGDPNIRFYAGCPLSSAGQRKLGTLCIIDREPRTLGEEDTEALKDLAAMVERELVAIQLATLDELTGISNRRGFMMLARHALHFCGRQSLPAALVFIDLDKFKQINDSFGHAEGDRALVVMAESIANTYRDSDVFGRLGGDEFAVLLTNTSKEHAEQLIERLRESLDLFNREEGSRYELSFSHGIVEFDPDRHEAVDALLADADSLMYELKRDHR